MKIAVIGYSGAGKSTLAKKLAAHYDCPLLYLDTVQFEVGWKERDRREALAMVAACLEQPARVIDGNYRQFYHQRRMEEADRIIFLRFSRCRCFFRPSAASCATGTAPGKAWRRAARKSLIGSSPAGFSGTAGQGKSGADTPIYAAGTGIRSLYVGIGKRSTGC